MPTREQILNDVDRFSSVELAEAITGGVVTMEELEGTFELQAAKRRDIIGIMAGGEIREWEKACSDNTEEAYLRYLRVYPDGKHCDEARAGITRIKQEATIKEEQACFDEASRVNTEASFQNYLNRYPAGHFARDARARVNDIRSGVDDISKIKALIESGESLLDDNGNLKIGTGRDVLELLARNQNALSAAVVKKLIDNNIITSGDLNELGIKKGFIDKLFGYSPIRLDARVRRYFPPEKISGIETEIYFWGIPASGKTCAIGTILSTAHRVARSLSMHNDSKAYGYMNELSAPFVPDEICMLPEGTPVGMIHEMKITIEDHEKKFHRVALLDLAGEVFTCMYDKHAGYMLSEEQEETLETITRLLKDPANRKMHFFVIEYGAENKLFNDMPQRLFLASAAEYIETHGVFNESTDSIHIILTKTDQIPPDVKDKAQHLREYINRHFDGFYKRLTSICESRKINRGRVGMLPMTLGEVCFQNMCLFDSVSASKAVKLIIDSSVGILPNNKWYRKVGGQLSK